MSPGILAGTEGSSKDWVGLLEIFSALIGLDGTTGWRMRLLGWLDISTGSCDEDALLIPGYILLVGMRNLGCGAELEVVLSSTTSDDCISCFSDVVTSMDVVFEL